MSVDHNYPSRYEIREVLSKITTSTFAKKFAQKHGVFIPNGNRKTIAEMLSQFFWDDGDITEIQNEAFQKKSIFALSGFTVKPKYETDLGDALSSLIGSGKLEYDIDTPYLISSENETFRAYKSRIEYNKTKVGKLQFLQEEKVDFDFYIKQKEKCVWQIEVDSKRSKDLSIIREIYERKIDLRKNIEEIEIDYLTTSKAIIFLDRLRNEGLNKNWEFRDIKQLTLKRPKPISNEDDEDNEDDEFGLEANEEQISGITQAILAGHHLRDDPFVKQSEKDGYLFTSMTYLFYHLKEALAIQIKAEFKGKPKVFEISIIRSAEIQGTNEIPLENRLPNKMDLDIRTEFWNNALRIFNDIKSK